MREFYKRMYSTKEFYYLIEKAFKSMKNFKRAIKNNLIDESFKEKIMLAVTEVNGCELCNTYHTKNAVALNISQIEINTLSSGGFKIGTTVEDEAIEFAKHYAISNGEYDHVKWQKLVENNGEETAEGILGVIRVIMMGNAHGIAAGALWERLNFKPVKGSTFLNEIGVLLSLIIFVPVIAIKRLIIK